MARDKTHAVVANALTKAGWEVPDRQEALVIPDRPGGRRLYIDISATRTSDQIAVLVEVKGYENVVSPVTYLERVIGQYLVYQAVLDYQESTIPLYLAVPQSGYEAVFREQLGQIVVTRYAINLLVYNEMQQEIIEWMPSI